MFIINVGGECPGVNGISGRSMEAIFAGLDGGVTGPAGEPLRPALEIRERVISIEPFGQRNPQQIGNHWHEIQG